MSRPVAAVVVATGPTTASVVPPTVLRRVGGITLLERAVRVLREAGIERIVVVAGHRAAQLEEAIRRSRLDAELVVDPDYRSGTASAVAAGLRAVGSDRVLVAMGDHVFEAADARALLAAPGRNVLAVDPDQRRQVGGLGGLPPAHVHLGDDGQVVRLETVSKVRDRTGYVVDAGLAVLDPEDLLAVAPAEDTPASWNAWRQRLIDAGYSLQASEVRGLWGSVDSPEAVRTLERAMWRRYGPKPTDGVVARTVNRRISGPLTRQLLRTGMAPDVATVLAFGFTLAAAVLLALGDRWLMLAGGLLVILGGALDGVDGELARVSGRSSRRGAVLDTLLDRYADLAVVLGLVLGARAGVTGWIWGFAAACGCLLVSYLHAVGRDTDVRLLFRREVRLLIFALSAIAGFPLWGLAAVAVAANIDVVRGVVLLLRAVHR